MTNIQTPENWCQFTLRAVTKLQGGKTPSKSEPAFWAPGEHAWASPKDMKYTLITQTQDQVSNEALASGGLKLYPQGSIIFVVRSGILKHSFPVAITQIPVTVNQDLKVIEPVAQLNTKYLHYLLRSFSPEILQHCSKSGTTVGSVEIPLLEAYSFPLAPLAEQKIIADKLDTLLAQAENTKARLQRIPQLLKRFRQSLLIDAVTGKLTEEWRRASNTKNWETGTLRDFIEKPQYGTSAKSQKDGTTPVLRMGNLQDGKLDWSDLVFTSDIDEIEKYRLEAGDVLFNRTNSPELVGKTSIYRGEREAIYAGYLIKIKCTERLNPEFLNYHLNSPSAKDYCKSVKSDGVSQSNINAKKIGEYPISCPPIDEQTEIVRRVEKLFTYADTIEQQVNSALTRVEKLTQSILAKAFRGELTADWHAQNPDLISGENSAAALLERIKAERAAVKPVRKTRKRAAT